MERVLDGGPELAKDRFTLVRSAHPSEERAARPAAAARAWPVRQDLLPLGYFAGVAAVLIGCGYPGWRIAVLGVAAAALQASSFACRRGDVRECVNADWEQIARYVVRGQTTLLVSTAVAIGVTGGVRSPLLVTLVGAWSAAAAVVGDRRQTRLFLAATALAAALLAALPPGATGPPLPGAWHAVLTAWSVLGVGALLAPVHAAIRRKRDEIVRQRNEIASDALARAESLEQIGSKLAHELKNPLTGVKALVQLGLRNPAEAASHERLDVVDREVTRMQEILERALSFTRPLAHVTRRPVALGPLVADTLVVLSGRADDARVRLYAQGDAALDADPHLLKNALLNLVSNAIEATPPGGEVAVEVRGTPAGEAEIVVRDSGRGMAPETLARIGTPFFTTRADGTGLGVLLARSVIAQHGGALRYESEPGKGTRVSVTLPRPEAGGGDAARAARG